MYEKDLKRAKQPSQQRFKEAAATNSWLSDKT